MHTILGIYFNTKLIIYHLDYCSDYNSTNVQVLVN